MSFKEKTTWIMAVIVFTAYIAYVNIILGRADGIPLTEVAYVSALLWTIGIVIVATIAVHIVVAISSPEDAGKSDQRDKEIERLGEHTGHWFVSIGAMAATGMAMAELSYFWIANVIFLAFVLSTLLDAVTKIIAYRRGFHGW